MEHISSAVMAIATEGSARKTAKIRDISPYKIKFHAISEACKVKNDVDVSINKDLHQEDMPDLVRDFSKSE